MKNRGLDLAPKNIAGFDPVATCGDCWFDPDAAEMPVRFFRECIRHVDGDRAGKPFELEDWQKDIVRTLFGWKRESGHRRFREALIMIPRKNGKSTLAAGLSLFMLLCDNERRAQCYCAAGDKEQASLVYSIAADMASQDKAISKSTKTLRSRYRILHKDRFLRAVAAADGAIHGTKPHWVCGDEIHVWKNRLLYEAFHTGTGASERSLECYITTAGHGRETFGYEMFDRARKVRDGTVPDIGFFPAIYAAEEGDDWKDESTWAKANPNLGVSVSLEFLRNECERAKRDPTYENTFRQLYLNQWMQQSERWIPMDSWKACPVTREAIEPGATVTQGLDLSSTTDFTALVTAAKTATSVKVWGHYWVPEKRADYLSRKHNIPLHEWHRDGWVTFCPGSHIEYGGIHDHILADSEKWNVQAIAYDPHNAHHTRVYLEEECGLPMIEMKQGRMTMNWPSKQFHRLVVAEELDWSGDPVMRWMADNAEVNYDNNRNILLVKSEGSKVNHIDGIVAAIMAIGQLGEESGSIYEEPGALFG